MPGSLAPPRPLINVMIMGTTLRLVGLPSHSLWLDEGATWFNATQPTFAETVFAEANHPPAWWVVTRLWTQAFGDSVPALRAPAAILGVAAIWLAWLLGLKLLDPDHAPSRGGFAGMPDGGLGRRKAAWFAGLLAGSAYFVEYAQEARMYSLLLVEVLGLSLLYLRWLDRGERWTLWAYAALGALALHTHYFAVWPLLATAAHALLVARRSRGTERPVPGLPVLAATAAAGLLFVPWFLYLLGHYERIATGDPYEPFSRLLYVLWRFAAGPGLVVVDRARLDEGVPAVLAEEWPIVAGVAALWFVPMTIGILSLRRLPGAASYVAASLLVPIVLILAVFPWFPLVHERYLCFLAPWVLLLAVQGAFRPGGVASGAMLGGLSVLSLVGLVAYFAPAPGYVAQGERTTLGGKGVPVAFVPRPDDPLRVLHHGHPYGKEPWRPAHEFVRTHARPGDVVLLHPGYLHLVWDYYDRGKLERVLLPNELLGPEEMRARHGDALRKRTRVFLVLAHEETEHPDDYFGAVLRLLTALWTEEGASSFQAIPPVLFQRSWGVRVAVFDRS